MTPYLPVEFHCHGIDRFDFSDFRTIDFAELDELARREGILCVITVFLPRHRVAEFDRFMRAFEEHRSRVRSNLVGVALEGPLLASVGGTPATGTWAPSEREWETIASWGRSGLRYVVLSPDAGMGAPIGRDVHADGPPVDWIAGTLAANGISPSLGHFQRSDPEASASAIDDVVRAVRDSSSSPPPVLTDHLFNDMPLAFRHAWRTAEDRERRVEELAANRLDEWKLDNLDALAGVVPATLIRAAAEGDVVLCLNFDGEHVDPVVCKRVVELVGSDAVIAMTDRIEVARLAGQPLARIDDNALWYQADGVVAAGSSAIDQQMRTMRSLGLREQAVWDIASVVAYRVLGLAPGDHAGPLDEPVYSYVSESFERTVVP